MMTGHDSRGSVEVDNLSDDVSMALIKKRPTMACGHNMGKHED